MPLPYLVLILACSQGPSERYLQVPEDVPPLPFDQSMALDTLAIGTDSLVLEAEIHTDPGCPRIGVQAESDVFLTLRTLRGPFPNGVSFAGNALIGDAYSGVWTTVPEVHAVEGSTNRIGGWVEGFPGGWYDCVLVHALADVIAPGRRDPVVLRAQPPIRSIRK